MKKVNTCGLKIIGLKNASGNTEDYSFSSGMYDEIFYNVETGEVWTVFHCSIGRNSWTEYHNPNIRRICFTDKHMTMQEIANAIHDKMTI